MNLVLEFRKSDDYEKMLALVSGMRNMVIGISSEKESPVSRKHWEGFVASLFNQMEEDYYWTVAEKPERLGPDDRVEFCTFPTAVSLSAIARDHLLRPQGLGEKERTLFAEAASRFEMKGFGEDHLFQVCEILLMFLEGGLPAVMTRYYPENPLRNALIFWQKELKTRVNEGNTLLPFGGDYREIFTLILNGLNDGLGEV